MDNIPSGAFFETQRVLHKMFQTDFKSTAVCACVFSASLGQVYEQHQDEDGFLYVAYSSETTFG